MNISYNKTINECKNEFNNKITLLLQQSQKSNNNNKNNSNNEMNKSQLNFTNFNKLLYLFRVSLFGFKQNTNKWKLPNKYISKSEQYKNDNKWFIISVRRLYTIFLLLIKTSSQSKHFISEIIHSNNSNKTQQILQFKFLCIIFTKYLQIQTNEIKEQQSIIISLWNIIDCNKWKYFNNISKIQQIQCQIFCYKLLNYLFIYAPFLSVTNSIFNQYMQLDNSSQNNNNNNTKTILGLLHTIIIRYFQFSKINKNNNNEIEMDIDNNNNENKMSEDENDNDNDNDQKMDNKSSKSINDNKQNNNEETQVISLICLEILSIPNYIKRLNKYNLDSVIKSFVSDNIWNEIITQFNIYCNQIYDSFIFASKTNNNKKIQKYEIWQKLVTVSSINENEEKKQNDNDDDINVMDLPDYDDYDYSSDDSIDNNNNINTLQTFINMTEKTETEMETETETQLYMNPNQKIPLLNKRNKRRNKRKKIKNNQLNGNIINELPAIVWTIHNLLNLYCDKKKFELNNNCDKNIKIFISFLNIAQITFKLLDFITPIQYGYHIAFPYDNLECKYDTYYINTFNKWCCYELLSKISQIINNNNNNNLSLNDYCIICKYLLQIVEHFPSNKQHYIWNNLGLITIDDNDNNIKDKNIIISLYKNVFCKYNIFENKHWQSIIKQYINNFDSLSYFINKTQQLKNKNKSEQYNQYIFKLEECTQYMEIFELFLIGINYFLRIIDDEQFNKYNIPFTQDIWIKFIQIFKYICFISYWKNYSYLNKFKSYFLKRNKNNKINTNNPLLPLNLLEIYSDTFDKFISRITCVFSSLRDRNSRKSFINDNNIWLMDKYIDLKQFEKEILNISDNEMKHNNDNDIEMNNNNNNFVDQFNPFSNREFGYNEMYGGLMNDNNNNNANQSQENLQRFDDNFNINKTEINDNKKQNNNYKRSFLILIEIPFVIPFKLRVKLFYKLIEFEKDQLESSGNSIRINRGNAIRARIGRDNILDDGYRRLNIYNSELKTLIQIEFENKHGEIEAGIDGGGIFKEFLNELMRDAFDPERGLFFETEYRKELYPNPNYKIFQQLMNVDKNYYEFLGKMVGKALYDSVLIEPIFSNFFLRKLLSQHNYIDDLQSYDIDLYKQLMLLKHDYSNKNNIQNMEITFSVTQEILGSKRMYNLIPNGNNILVNHKNRHKYINILADYKLNKSMYKQSISFLRGMSNVINLDYLRIFDANELSKLLSGDSLDNNNWINAWKDLRENTVYSGGFHNKHRLIKWFWEILNNDLTYNDNQKLLMFVTSCTRSPLLGFKSLNPKFSIMCTGGDTKNLPTSQTCMNLLKLPNYHTKELLKQKLLQSIRSNAGFDLS